MCVFSRRVENGVDRFSSNSGVGGVDGGREGVTARHGREEIGRGHEGGRLQHPWQAGRHRASMDFWAQGVQLGFGDSEEDD